MKGDNLNIVAIATVFAVLIGFFAPAMVVVLFSTSCFIAGAALTLAEHEEDLWD